MLRHTMLSVLAALMFAGTAGATERTFEFTGTVDYSIDARMPVGAKVTGRFSYDDATVPDYTHSFAASYTPDSFVSQAISGHQITSNGLNVYIQDFVGDEGTDVVDINGTGGMMIDDQVYADGYFGFRLHGDSNANTSVALPSSIDITRYNRERYGNVFDGNGNMLANYSIDSIRSVAGPVCFKKNGKPFKKCPKPRG